MINGLKSPAAAGLQNWIDATPLHPNGWYYSEEKLEPRFGDRYADPGAEQEMPLAVGRDVYLLSKKIEKKLLEKFHINHCNFQPEFQRDDLKELIKQD